MSRIILHNYFPARRTKDSPEWELVSNLTSTILNGAIIYMTASMAYGTLRDWLLGVGRSAPPEQKAKVEKALAKAKRGEVKTSAGQKDDWSPEARAKAAESRKKGGGPGPMELTKAAKLPSSQELRKGRQAEKKNTESFNKKHFEDWQAKQKTSPSPQPKQYEAPKSNRPPLELK
jgi:hypothetical protein